VFCTLALGVGLGEPNAVEVWFRVIGLTCGVFGWKVMEFAGPPLNGKHVDLKSCFSNGPEGTNTSWGDQLPLRMLDPFRGLQYFSSVQQLHFGTVDVAGRLLFTLHV
jgi:hypothetical protein